MEIALLTASTSHNAYLNTKAMLEGLGHNVTNVPEADIPSHNFSVYDVAVAVRPTNTNTDYRQIIDTHQTPLLLTMVCSGLNSGNDLATLGTLIDLCPNANLVSNEVGVTGNVLTDVTHPATQGQALGPLPIYTASNFFGAYTEGASYVGMTVSVGGRSGTSGTYVTDFPEGVAIEQGTLDMAGNVVPTNVFISGSLYAGQSAYTAEGADYFDGVLTWLATANTPDPEPEAPTPELRDASGYPAPFLANQLKSANRRWDFRYELLDVNNNHKAWLSTVIDASVSNNNLAEIRRTAKFTMTDDPQVDWLADRIRPWARLTMPALTGLNEFSEGTHTNTEDNNGLVLADPSANEGNWTDSIPLHGLDVAGMTFIEWDADVPNNTALAVEYSTDSTNWVPAESGGELLGVSGTRDNTVYIRLRLSSVDGFSTPTVRSINVRVASRSQYTGYAEWPMGVFLLSTPERKSTPFGTIVREVEAYDQNIILLDDRLDDRYTLTAGTNYGSAIESLLSESGISLSLPLTSESMPTTREWEPGTSKHRIINDLLAAINYTPLHFHGDGEAMAEPYVSPANAPIEYVYADDQDSVILPDGSERQDLFNIANKWVIAVSEPDREPLVSTYTNDDIASPTSTVNRGRTIVDYREGEQAPSQATLDARVERIAFEASQVYSIVEMETGIMPFHGDRSVVEIRHSSLDVSDIYAEHTWECELKAGGKMKHRLRRVVTI